MEKIPLTILSKKNNLFMRLFKAFVKRGLRKGIHSDKESQFKIYQFHKGIGYDYSLRRLVSRLRNTLTKSFDLFEN